MVVEPEVTLQALPGGTDRWVSSQIHLLVFHAPPQPFDEHVVAPAALAVHADGAAVLLQPPGEVQAGELTTLVGVEDSRGTVFRDRLADRLHTEEGVAPCTRWGDFL